MDEYTTVVKNKFHLIDHRDYHIPGNKADDTHVIKYLNSFSVNISYYTRSHNSTRKYLNPDLNIMKIYELYIAQCEDEDIVPEKEKYYYKTSSRIAVDRMATSEEMFVFSFDLKQALAFP
ncbi:hypothetical protein HZH68_007319 [Vespula germanica]|uniref:Uncharacterized protein n=1 Tax=Vespula germanica TaxID=30212 RepID=A0A834K6P5_VESGE|nr:hypothetical protein HZH68_007319 [Vespula germanica]